MSHDEILAVVISAVTRSQEQSLRAVDDFHADTRLIGDVPGCDSLAAVELSFLLADGLAPIFGGKGVPKTLLLGKGYKERFTLGQIAQRIYDHAHKSNSKRTSNKSSVTTNSANSPDGAIASKHLPPPSPKPPTAVLIGPLLPLDPQQYSEKNSNGYHN